MKRECVIMGVFVLILLVMPFASLAQDKSAALQRLYEAAKKEGRLVVHDGSTIEEITPIMQAFEKRFPGIKVQAIVQPAPVIPQRIIVEAQAGKLSIDLAQGSIQSWMMDLMDRGLVRKLDLSKVIDVDPTSVWGGGMLHITQSIVPCFVYNTNLVSKADEPRTYEDLLNPKWKGGRIFLSGIGTLLTTMFFTRKEDEVVDFLTKLRKQELVIKRDPRACTSDVVSGEAFIGETFSRIFMQVKPRGAPIELAPISPALYNPDGTYALNRSPHPNAAELWTAWRMTPEGREVTYKVQGYAPEIKCGNSPSAQYLCDKGIKFRVLQTVEDGRLLGKYQQRVRELLGIVPAK